MNRVLVIGATGNVGHQVVSQLVSTGAQVRAMTRNPDTAGLPPQVEMMRGDLTVPETLDACLEGIDTVFLVWVAQPPLLLPLWNGSKARTAHRIPLSPAQDGTPLLPTARSGARGDCANRASD